ncbi:MAG: DSD1 family PLP-dependent enzyme [Acidobacteriota bacterium]
MNLHDLRTPAFVVDLPRFQANCRMARETAQRLGVRLRPHVKTHKTLEGARLQLGAPAGPITVSTLAEAEFFVQAGFTDITYAVAPTPAKLEDLVRLARRVERLNLVTDQPELLPALEDAARRLGRPWDLFLKVDCGNRRMGVQPEASEALTTAQTFASSSGVRLRGLLTHAGQAYGVTDPAQKREIAVWEGRCLVEFAARLRAAGIPCEEVSVGSTPTLVHAPERLPGVTEIRPGNYVFFDLQQLASGNCTVDRIAGFVLASVIGVYPEQRRAVIDAGALALSKDAVSGPRPVYARVAEHPVLEVTGVSQEHGIVTSPEEFDFRRLRVGERVRLIPAHSCLAAATFPHYFVVEGERVVDRWVPVRGW